MESKQRREIKTFSRRQNAVAWCSRCLFSPEALRFYSLKNLEIKLEIKRHRGAIKLNDLSRPVRLAVSFGVLKKENTLFDYGCGHGEDIKLLGNQGYQTNGWDPYYFPQNQLQRADIINLGYVLNVIENEQERREALKNAWELTDKLLIVAAQISVGEPGKGHIAYNDGFVTARNTFQKYYEQNELK